jgi:hypothetical protein
VFFKEYNPGLYFGAARRGQDSMLVRPILRADRQFRDHDADLHLHHAPGFAGCRLAVLCLPGCAK